MISQNEPRAIWMLTEAVANRIYALAYAASLIGAIVTALATATLFWSSSVRDRFSDERIAHSRAEVEQARLLAARANLEAQRIKAAVAWRELSAGQIRGLEQKLASKHFKVTIITRRAGDDAEAYFFAGQIAKILKQAGLDADGPFTLLGQGMGLSYLPGPDVAENQDLLSAFAAIGINLPTSEIAPIPSYGVQIIVGSRYPPQF